MAWLPFLLLEAVLTLSARAQASSGPWGWGCPHRHPHRPPTAWSERSAGSSAVPTLAVLCSVFDLRLRCARAVGGGKKPSFSGTPPPSLGACASASFGTGVREGILTAAGSNLVFLLSRNPDKMG